MSKFSDLFQSSELCEQFLKLEVSTTLATSADRSDQKRKDKSKKKKHKNQRKHSPYSEVTDNFNFSKNQPKGTSDVRALNPFYLEPFGLQNVRNSCFLNASLQLLFSIPSLCVEFLKLKQNYTPTNTDNVTVDQNGKEFNTPLLNQLLLLFKQFSPRSTNNLIIDCSVQSGVIPFDLKSTFTLNHEIGKIIHMDSGSQEDVAECLTHILSSLHKEWGSINLSVCKSTNQVEEDFDESDWIVTDRTGKSHPIARKTKLEGNPTPISQLFSGMLMTRTSMDKIFNEREGLYDQSQSQVLNQSSFSKRNSHKLATNEPFFILPMEIDNPKITSVESALRHLAHPEEVTDYFDSQGTRIPTIRRRSTVDRLPPYFIFQLKRFHYASSNVSDSVCHQLSSSNPFPIKKNLKLIQIQPEIVLPKEFLSQETHFNNLERRYRLWAIIFHLGYTVASGHYTTAIRWNNHSQLNSNTTQIRNNHSFLYLDDDHACLIQNSDSANLLLTSHRPLETRNCKFHSLPKQPLSQTDHISNLKQFNILKQPRTPYIVVYESCSIPSEQQQQPQ